MLRIAWAVLVLSVAQPGEDKADALPAGAVRQLGEVRIPNVGHVLGVAFSPDGRTIAGGSWDGSVRVWDTATGKEPCKLLGHKAAVVDVAFTPDAKILVTRSGDHTLRLWDSTTGKPLRAIGIDYFAGSVVGPKGDWVAGHVGTELVVWELASGKELWRRHAEGPLVGAGADGQSIIEATRIPSFVLWDAKSGEVLREIETSARFVLPLAVHGQKLVYFGAAGLHFHDIVTGRQAVRPVPIAFRDRLAIAPNGKMIAISHLDEIQVVETATGQERCRFRGLERGRIPLAFAPDGRLLASGSTDSTVLLWDLFGKQTPPVTKADLDSVWTDLASKEAALAFRAMGRVMAKPEDGVAMLRERVVPDKSTARPDEIGRLIDDLASDQFAARSKAAAELGRLGGCAEPALQKALEKKSTLETRRRVEKLLAAIEDTRSNPSPTGLRIVRAVEALESLDTPAAKALLEEWAQGNPWQLLTREANAALTHLKQRPAARR